MPSLYSIAEVLAATGGRAENLAGSAAVASLSIDSREIGDGALFVAIKGARFDGHDFVAQAIEAGAVAALVSADRAKEAHGLPLIVVPDALEGLVALARFARARSGARIVAVTGSAGKTTTKEAIRVLLESAGETHASIRSFNNHWGVPLMLARMPASARFGVFEIGMSRAGEIAPLSRLVRPHVAVITTVAEAHLEFFSGLAEIADAKAEIFSGLGPGGVAILNRDHSQAERLLGHAADAGVETLTYGFSEAADVVIADPRAQGEGIGGRLSGAGIGLDLVLPTPGRHMLANAAGALLAARACGVLPERGAQILARHGAPEGRGAVHRLGSSDNPLVLIDESYNANPASMRAALDVFSGLPAGGGRKVLVLGDMRELGGAADALHAELLPDVLAAGPDMIFLIGAHMEALAQLLPSPLVKGQARTVEEIADRLIASLAYGDSVMVKGSNGVGLGALVRDIRARF